MTLGRGQTAAGKAIEFSRQCATLILLISVLILVPCFWHEHIGVGDLPSHVYNAWLAQLIGQGKAPGLYFVTQWKNVLFDYMLLALGNLFGFAVAEKIAVSVCVLIFFWGVFAFITAVTRKPAWFLTPLIAMLAYGYVFQMGFMNYYASIGLACIGLALLWNGQKNDIWAGLVLLPLMYLAHPLGFLWFSGAAVYRLLWTKAGWPFQLVLPASVVLVAFATRVFFKRHIEYLAYWGAIPLHERTGLDQLIVFNQHRFQILSRAILLFVLICVGAELFRAGRNSDYWRKRALILGMYLASCAATLFLPEDMRPDPAAGWIGLLVTRLTIISAIFGLCWLGTLEPKRWHLAGFAICAGIFFSFVYRETEFFNRMERNAQKLVRAFPDGTRFTATVYLPPGYRAIYLHIVERACVQHCFVYSNYEPSSLMFRIRAKPGNWMVASSADDSEDMQSGEFQFQATDLPLNQIYQCDGTDLTRLCVRKLFAGDAGSDVGYRPASQ